jgi:pilus assembly protein CpaE
MSAVSSETILVADVGVDVEMLRASMPPGPATMLSLAQGVDSVLTIVDDSKPSLLVIGCTSSSNTALELLREARRRHENCAIVVLYGGSPNGFMDRAFQLGADDLITLPQPQGAVIFALEKAVSRRRGAGGGVALAPLICIVGPKGGTGKTLTACNLGVALARAGARSVLVDIDLQFGDVGLALGLPPDRTIYDLAVSGSTVDSDTVGRFLTLHASGLNTLLAPVRPDQAGAIKPDFLRQVYMALRVEHDFVIIDTPPAFSPEVIATIDIATNLCVVGMLDALSLKDTKIGLETLALMGRNADDITLVLNRSDTSVGISHADVATILGRAPAVLVPSDRAIPRAVTEGMPIVLADERSGPAQAFKQLAQLYLRESAYATASGSVESSKRAGGRRSLMRKGR